MKAIGLLLISFFVICVSTTTVVASNESDKAKIQRAMKAAPSSISAEATIMDATFTTLREGTNGWTCFPGVPLIPGDKHPMCNDAVWMEWLAAILDETLFLPEEDENSWRPSTIGYSYMLRGDALVSNHDPSGAEGPWDQEGPHLMMLFPTSVDLDLPDYPDAGGPYVMWGGTPMVHVMVPLTDRDR
jgi:hypothetical protein